MRFLFILIFGFAITGPCVYSKRVNAFIVANVTTGKILAKKNADKACSPASLTKKMTLYLLFEALHNRQITFHTKFLISQNAASQIPSKLHVKPGEKISVKSIIEALIVKSANDVAVVAAEGLCGSVKAFVQKMNQTAKRLGMHQTHFCNPSGIHHPDQKTTARDMAILARALLKQYPEFSALFKLRSFRYKGQIHYTHNKLLDTFQGTNGMKTGYVDNSGYNMTTSAVRFNQEGEKIHLLAIVIGQPSSYARAKKTVELLEPYFLKEKALFYDAAHTALPGKEGIPLSNSWTVRKDAHPAVFLRANLYTKKGLKYMLQQWKEKFKNSFTKPNHNYPKARSAFSKNTLM